ncbi:MAG: HPr-rel-A system PqqD family peptide chaperone [Rhodoferax sp.]|nr:HPr-rel-A system PqqD family peptide chaperone [Rhodoferax sp.]
MQAFSRVSGVRVEPMGRVWAAYSPATGETTLLNDECASVLEVLEAGPATTKAICAELAADIGLPAEQLGVLVNASWAQLLEAGLVREHRVGHIGPQ